MKKTTSEFLNRFTDLAVALDILTRRKLTLLSPETWEDRNDAYYLERYKKEQSLSTLVAACFSRRGERFHHWSVFASGPCGVCLEFNRERLLKSFPATQGFRTDDVTYHPVPDIEHKKPNIQKWPFLKRIAYRDEEEFRIICESVSETARSKAVPIDLAALQKITLSPWMPDPVADSVEKVLRTISGCERCTINRSTLLENSRWRKAIESGRTTASSQPSSADAPARGSR
jgi:hypothetical protein